MQRDGRSLTSSPRGATVRRMHVRRDAVFDEEVERHQLRFTCESCANFSVERDACRHEWPTALHRLARYADPAVVEVVFCKEFELR